MYIKVKVSGINKEDKTRRLEFLCTHYESTCFTFFI